jgi:hypothetical protein
MSGGMQEGPAQQGPYQGGQPQGGPQQFQQFQQPQYGQQQYGQPQYVPPPYGPPPQAAAPRKRKKWPWVLLAVFVLIAGMIAFNPGGGQEAETTSGTGENATGAETEESDEGAGEAGDFAAGEAAQLGDWVVTVNGTETAATYGDEFFEEQAQGEFVIVDMTVENGGSEATYFDDTALSLVDADGNSHSASATASGDFFLEQINPGNQASGAAVFDVPEGTEAVALEVEDTWSFEDPIRIRLD